MVLKGFLWRGPFWKSSFHILVFRNGVHISMIIFALEPISPEQTQHTQIHTRSLSLTLNTPRGASEGNFPRGRPILFATSGMHHAMKSDAADLPWNSINNWKHSHSLLSKKQRAYVHQQRGLPQLKKKSALELSRYGHCALAIKEALNARQE